MYPDSTSSNKVTNVDVYCENIEDTSGEENRRSTPRSPSPNADAVGNFSTLYVVNLL